MRNQEKMIYPQKVSEAFNTIKPDKFGDAHLTATEISAIRKLFNRFGSREKVIEHIKEFGVPIPENITAEDLAKAGIAHACGVTEHLASERGPEGARNTYESYTIKSRFDRFVYRHLPESLKEEWGKPIDRESGYRNEIVSYPKGVDEGKVYGGALPHRFLPAQTMKNIELARLGKLDNTTKQIWEISDDTNLKMFDVEWNTLIPAIESAKTISELTENIVSTLKKQLQENGLSEDAINTIIKTGFSTEGLRLEYGNIEELKLYHS